MTPFPVNLADIFGHWEAYIVFLLIGIAFGVALEISGFGNSRKLAAQFYFKDMTVFKVMFTAIIVAMSLIFLTSALGLLDYNMVWVNPTYLWPGIIGGLLMGVGFIIGGFCPGTSLVSAATLKLDGLMFVLGVLFGIFLFGETVQGFEDFWYSSYYGRYTLPEFLGVSTGVVVFGVVLMALFAFWGAEQLERIFGGKVTSAGSVIPFANRPRWRLAAAGTLGAIAFVGLVIGQPTNADRWKMIEDERQAQLDNREVQIHPGELLANIYDRHIKVVVIDVRSESDYNLFHIQDARHIPLNDVLYRAEALRDEPSNTLFVTVSNDETAATEAWRLLVAESVPNVYILEGGINNWIDVFATPEFRDQHPVIEAGDDELRYAFNTALGARYHVAAPHMDQFEDLEYEEKVKLEIASGPASGGCG